MVSELSQAGPAPDAGCWGGLLGLLTIHTHKKRRAILTDKAILPIMNAEGRAAKALRSVGLLIRELHHYGKISWRKLIEHRSIESRPVDHILPGVSEHQLRDGATLEATSEVCE